ncbi:hypothetical protein GCM10017557_65760 [Streptomyces aurantiacus]|uniref:Uncharacterized protein n=1 Tax=Streptomyces aurantiacus TaxID=47760 RepID=A0A7G1PD73_9ACTN|nr:hypothetical protein GCM10017557_65760 [Streptomyces aurantiacus]
MGYAGAWLTPHDEGGHDGGGLDVTAGIPVFEDEHASLSAPEGPRSPAGAAGHQRRRPGKVDRRPTTALRVADNRLIGG